MKVEPACNRADLEAVRRLLGEYAASLDVDLRQQGFDQELATLPGRYAPPGGALLLARDLTREPVGCVAIRALPVDGACEMKRLYVRPAARRAGAGLQLARAALDCAAALGYRRILLDTLPGMAAAAKLYRSLDFVPIAPYADPVYPGTLFFGRDLCR